MSEPCGCCAGIEAVTPVALVNRPGLGAIAYRVGTHATFLETMLARLTTLGVKLGSDEIASWLLSPPDLIEPRSLARKLQTSSDPLSAYLRERLSSGARRVLDPYDWRLGERNIWKVERMLLEWPHRRIASSDRRVDRLRRRYRAFRDAHGYKPWKYYRGRDRWTDLPPEFRTRG